MVAAGWNLTSHMTSDYNTHVIALAHRREEVVRLRGSLCRGRGVLTRQRQDDEEWQEFPYDCQRMPAAPLRRLARTNSEPSRQDARFAPHQGLRGSVHALPLSAILTAPDHAFDSPAAHVGQGRCGFLLVSGMRWSRGVAWAQAMRSRLHARIRCEDALRAVGFVVVRGCQQDSSGVLVVRARSQPGKMPGLLLAEVFREASTRCHSVHAMPLGPLARRPF